MIDLNYARIRIYRKPLRWQEKRSGRAVGVHISVKITRSLANLCEIGRPTVQDKSLAPETWNVQDVPGAPADDYQSYRFLLFQSLSRTLSNLIGDLIEDQWFGSYIIRVLGKARAVVEDLDPIGRPYFTVLGNRADESI